MIVRCSHGYFFFQEASAGDISKFCSTYGFEIVPKDDYYTFLKLQDAPDYSFTGKLYIDPTAIALETFEGKPWEVMRENKLIYDFTDGFVKPIDSVLVRLNVFDSANYSFSDGLILPGSINSKGQRVTDFTAHFPPDATKFRYTEILYG